MGWPRILTRGALITGALLLLALVIGTMGARYQILSSLCPGPMNACASDRQLLATDLASLQALGLTPAVYAIANLILETAVTLIFLGVAVSLVLRRKGDWYSYLTAALLIALSMDASLGMIKGTSPSAGLLEFAGNALLLPVLYLFPSGRFMPRWTGWLAVAAAIPTAGRILLPHTPLDPTAWPGWLGIPVYVLTYMTPAFAQFYRYRQSESPQHRQQIKWLSIGAVGMALCILGMIAGIILIQTGPVSPAIAKLVYALFRTLLMVPIPLSMAVAILRYRLWEVDLIIQRLLVGAGVGLGLVLLNLAAVAWLNAVFGIAHSLVISLVTSTLAALLIQPLYVWVRARVSRWVFGEQGDPVMVLTRLTRLLEAPKSPHDLLADLVKTTVDLLKLSHAQLALYQEAELITVAAAGAPGPEQISLPLTYQGEQLGEFLLSRQSGRSFTEHDLKLLTHIASQAAVSAHAIHLTEDLQRSRQRIVGAREEERRRLRRDLHDGIGPVLASLTLSLDAALNMLQRDPEPVRELLVDLREEARAATTSVRQTVYGLRPPSLDRGLGSALQELVQGYHHVELAIELTVPETLPTLPAAVEVALFRIGQEALTNVAKHAQASACTISLQVTEQAVQLQIEDDGIGIPTEHRPGVGLQSMRERAGELGGQLTIDSGSAGTKVTATLPLIGGVALGAD